MGWARNSTLTLQLKAHRKQGEGWGKVAIAGIYRAIRRLFYSWGRRLTNFRERHPLSVSPIMRHFSICRTPNLTRMSSTDQSQANVDLIVDMVHCACATSVTSWFDGCYGCSILIGSDEEELDTLFFARNTVTIIVRLAAMPMACVRWFCYLSSELP